MPQLPMMPLHSKDMMDETIVSSALDMALKRQDDLREAESRRVDEQMKLRAEFQIQLNVAEAKRIDAIRAVDVNAVSVANDRATQQAAVLANQVATSADALRALVAATAATVATQLAQITAQFTDRLSSLEKSSYEGQGKNTVQDPQLARLLTEMMAMKQGMDERRGGGAGIQNLGGWIVAGLTTLIAVASFILPRLN